MRGRRQASAKAARTRRFLRGFASPAQAVACGPRSGPPVRGTASADQDPQAPSGRRSRPAAKNRCRRRPAAPAGAAQHRFAKRGEQRRGRAPGARRDEGQERVDEDQHRVEQQRRERERAQRRRRRAARTETGRRCAVGTGSASPRAGRRRAPRPRRCRGARSAAARAAAASPASWSARGPPGRAGCGSRRARAAAGPAAGRRRPRRSGPSRRGNRGHPCRDSSATARRVRRRSPCRCASCVAPSAIAASKSPLMPIDSASSRWPAAFSASSSRRSSANQRRWRAASVSAGGSAMRPRSASRGSRRPRPRAPAAAAGATPRFRRLVAEPHLDADRERRQRCRPLRREPLRDAQAVHGVHPVESPRRPARVLLVCSAPMKCRRRSRPASALEMRRASWT